MTGGPPAPVEASSRDRASVACVGGNHFLVIAADETLRRFVADALAEYGYRTTSAAGSAGGLVAAVTKPPALILLDLRESELGGQTFAAWYRWQPGPHAPLVLLSGADVAETVDAVEAQGAAGFLRLPFELDDLLHLAARTTRQGWPAATASTEAAPIGRAPVAEKQPTERLAPEDGWEPDAARNRHRSAPERSGASHRE